MYFISLQQKPPETLWYVIVRYINKTDLTTHLLNHSFSFFSLFFSSSFSCPTLSPLCSCFFLLFSLTFLLCFLHPSFPLCSLSPFLFPGSPGSSSAGVFPELTDLCAVRPVSGSRDLPHGADALLVFDAHVGRQLPYCSTPPWGSSYFCLQQDPPPTQH